MAAFKLAIENNYGIEFDIQLSKDNIPVVFHDYSLKRVCGVEGYVWDYTYEELKNFHLYNSNEKIPHLQEVLDLVDGKVPLIVELKGENKDTTISSIVAPYLDNYKGIYCVESFNPMIILWYKKIDLILLEVNSLHDINIETSPSVASFYTLHYKIYCLIF